MNRASFLKRASLLLIAPSATRAIDFGALAEAAPAASMGEFVAPVWLNTMTVTAGTGSYFKVADVIRNEFTGELLRVTKIDGDVLEYA